MESVEQRNCTRRRDNENKDSGTVNLGGSRDAVIHRDKAEHARGTVKLSSTISKKRIHIMKTSIWTNSGFTKRSSMTKRLTFQLKPTKETKEALQKDAVLETDRKNYDLVEALTPHLDVFYRHLIDECLAAAQLDWTEL